MTKILYDKYIKIVGIGQTPWQRFGPQYWFDNYKIVCQDNLELTSDFYGIDIYSLPKDSIRSGKSRESLQLLVNSDWFLTLYTRQLATYRFLAYKPLSSDNINRQKFIANDLSIGLKYENKKTVREILSNKVKFPKFETYLVADLEELAPFSLLRRKYGVFVVQDEMLSSGVGTYIIRSENDYMDCIDALKSYGRYVVISQFLKGYDLSIQCCTTKYGVFTGPIQKQLVDSAQLGNKEIKGVEKYNGVIIDSEYAHVIGHENVEKLKMYAKIVGEQMQGEGFKGIFSIDGYYDTKMKEVYFLEVNPRMTGVTPVFNLTQKDAALPLPLLHILEVGNYEYSIEELNKTDLNVKLRNTSMIIIRSKSDTPYIQKSFVKSGSYDERYRFISKDIDLRRDKYTVQIFVSPGMVVSPGDKLAQVFIFDNVEDTTGNLKPQYLKLVQYMYGLIR